ncbi:MAG: HIT domain-containing protein [Cyanobacteria bacterium]|nr:HIT domain-containing protein [Cyanobacteriota bacterium]
MSTESLDTPQNTSEENCLFCRMVRGEIPVEPIATGDATDLDTLVFKDLYPQAPVHWLIIPKHHTADVRHEGLAPALSARIDHQLFESARRAAKAHNISQFRLVLNTGADAGQSVFHQHLHLLAGRPFSWPPG